MQTRQPAYSKDRSRDWTRRTLASLPDEREETQLLPDAFDKLLAGHGLSLEDLTKVLTVEHLHHLILNQTVEGTDIRHHTGHRINGAMDRHEAVPFATLIAVLHRRERVTSRDAGDVEPGRRRHFGVQVFILIQPNRVERPDVFLRIQLGSRGHVPGFPTWESGP